MVDISEYKGLISDPDRCGNSDGRCLDSSGTVEVLQVSLEH